MSSHIFLMIIIVPVYLNPSGETEAAHLKVERLLLPHTVRRGGGLSDNGAVTTVLHLTLDSSLKAPFFQRMMARCW